MHVWPDVDAGFLNKREEKWQEVMDIDEVTKGVETQLHRMEIDLIIFNSISTLPNADMDVLATKNKKQAINGLGFIQLCKQQDPREGCGMKLKTQRTQSPV